MESSLSLEEFKSLALKYQQNKKAKKEQKKKDNEFYTYVCDRSYKIKKRCGYY